MTINYIWNNRNQWARPRVNHITVGLAFAVAFGVNGCNSFFEVNCIIYLTENKNHQHANSKSTFSHFQCEFVIWFYYWWCLTRTGRNWCQCQVCCLMYKTCPSLTINIYVIEGPSRKVYCWEEIHGGSLK